MATPNPASTPALIRVNLPRSLFSSPVETELVRHGEITVSVYSERDVACLRIRNSRGNILCLPYQGQQIWSAYFDGRELTMKSMFDKPKQTREYLQNYGAWLLHCGVSAMGCPGAQDRHPLHGELPNAPIDDAWLELGHEEALRGGRPFVRLCGEWRHTVAFTCNYRVQLSAELTAGKALVRVVVRVTNLRTHGSVPLMYLAHVNFRPHNGATLSYSAVPDAKHIRVRTAVPSHVTLSPEILAFINKLAAEPALHDEVSAAQPYDPEVVLYADYATDRQGWAHSLQILPDSNSADYIRHRPSQLPKAVRWISRTGDQDALGLCLPATAEPEGFAAEQAKGNVVSLAAGATWVAEFEAGALNKEEWWPIAGQITKIIQETVSPKKPLGASSFPDSAPPV